MNTITLNNDVQMPVIGFGTFLMNGAVCEESILAALRCGYRMIDTAEAYGNEEAVGMAIRKSGVPRKEIFITTKVNFRSYEHTRRAVAQSLEKLKTEYLDLVLLHWPFGNYYAAWRELEKLHQQGVVRAIGVSNFEPDRLIDLIAFNKTAPSVNQIEMHLLCQRHEERTWQKAYHVHTIAYAPLGQGRKNEMFFHPTTADIAAAHGKTTAQVALRFLLQNGTAVIPKAACEEHIKENFNIFDFELTADDMKRLAAMDTAAPLIGDPENPAMVEAAMNW